MQLLDLRSRCTSRANPGFSLVEVVLAIGIMAFSVLAILGLYSVLTGQAKDNIDRRYQLQSIEALRSTLNQQMGFDLVYANAREPAPMEFIYVTFRANAAGDPDPGGPEMRSRWAEVSGISTADLQALDSAREGRWIQARLTLSSASPLPRASLPDNVTAYPHSVLIFAADIAEVAQPLIAFPDVGYTTIPISVLR